MSSLYIIFLLLLLQRLHIQSAYSGCSLFESCFESLLIRSQNCKNNNVNYFGLQHSGGLGSEFNSYLMWAVIAAAMQNRRLIMIANWDNWEFNCPSKLNWGCYLRLPCTDSVLPVNNSQVETSLESNNLEINHIDVMSYRDISTRQYYNPKLPYIIRYYILPKEKREETFEDSLHRIFQDETNCAYNIYEFINGCPNPEYRMTVVATSYLFRLNNHTQHQVNRLNEPYKHILGYYRGINSIGSIRGRYIGLHIRVGDKDTERLKYGCKNVTEWLKNPDNIANEIVPLMKLSNISKIMVVSETCDMVPLLTESFKRRFNSEVETVDLCNCIQVYSTCSYPLSPHLTAEHEYLSGNTIRNIGRSRGDLNEWRDKTIGVTRALRVLADIELLVHAEHFFGSFDSNLVRLVSRLRVRHYGGMDETEHFLGETAYANTTRNWFKRNFLE